MQQECKHCQEMHMLIAKKEIKLDVIQTLVDGNRLCLYAANCQLNDLPKYIELGNH